MPPQNPPEPIVPPTIPQPYGAPALPPKSSGRKKWLIIGGVLLAVWLVGVGIYWWQFASKPQTTKLEPIKTDTQVVNDLAGSPITNETVAKINKEEAFFGYLINAAEQQKLIVTTEDTESTSPDDTDTTLDYYKAGFDFQTKKLVFAHDDVSASIYGQSRCFDGQSAVRLDKKLNWNVQPITDDDPTCGKNRLNMYYVVDGFNTGGLTSDQAQTFVGYLRQHPGLITVKNLELADHNGKQYLKFSAELMPIAATGDYAGEYYGNQWLMWGFNETGLDPDTHPYAYRGAGGEGLEIVYYVDPVTKLPVYSETKTLAGKDENGKTQPYDLYNHSRMTYQFGVSEFDASTENTANITLDW